MVPGRCSRQRVSRIGGANALAQAAAAGHLLPGRPYIRWPGIWNYINMFGVRAVANACRQFRWLASHPAPSWNQIAHFLDRAADSCSLPLTRSKMNSRPSPPPTVNRIFPSAVTPRAGAAGSGTCSDDQVLAILAPSRHLLPRDNFNNLLAFAQFPPHRCRSLVVILQRDLALQSMGRHVGRRPGRRSEPRSQRILDRRRCRRVRA
jgi:hypothetical protein